MVATLEPSAYTIILRNTQGLTGIGVVEIYDIDPLESSSAFGNLSSRGFVGVDHEVLIGGVIVFGDTKVLLRAMGPSLSSQGVDGALPDPSMEVFDADGNLLASNDNWPSDQAAEIIATAAPPNDLRESAIVTTLSDGAYTAIVRGVNSSTGVALVEAYLLPDQ